MANDGPLIEEVPRNVPQKVLAAVLFGLGLDTTGFALLSHFYSESCDPAHLLGPCKALIDNPPWILATTVAAAPAILLTWFWRTTERNADIRQHGEELRLRDRAERLREVEIQLWRDQLTQRDNEFREQQKTTEKTTAVRERAVRRRKDGEPSPATPIDVTTALRALGGITRPSQPLDISIVDSSLGDDTNSFEGVTYTMETKLVFGTPLDFERRNMVKEEW